MNGCLVLSNGLLQPIGTAVAKVQNATLTVPETPFSPNVVAFGKTAPNAVVTLYDNDLRVAQVTANAVGNWSAEFTLAGDLYNYSYHYIHAEIASSFFSGPVTTERRLVTYDESTAEVSTVTMYNTDDFGENVTVFDFTDADTEVPFYRYNPTMPTFSFEVRFSGNAAVSEVYVVTADQHGDETYVPMSYDAARRLWTGSYDFVGNPPAQVSVAYELEQITGTTFSEEIFEGLADDYTAYSTAVKDVLEADFSENLEMTYDEASDTALMAYTDPDTRESVEFATLRVEETSLPADVTIQSLLDLGYYPVENENGSFLLGYAEAGNSMVMTIVNADTREIHTETYDFSPILGGSPVMLASDSVPAISYPEVDWLNFANLTTEVLSSLPIPYLRAIGIGTGALIGIGEVWASNKIGNTIINGNRQILNSWLQTLMQMLDATCPDGTPKLSPAQQQEALAMMTDLASRMHAYGQQGDAWLNALGMANMMSLISTAAGTAQGIKGFRDYDKFKVKDFFDAAGSAMGDYGLDVAGDMVGDGLEQWANDEFHSIMADVWKCRDYMMLQYGGGVAGGGGGNCDKKPDPPYKTPPKPIKTGWDPSGYVYEAVPSNRLEDVTAVLYYKGSDGSDVQWNAADYDQVNPQVTDASGSYRWDVLTGDWKVVFHKDGYETADTTQVEQAVDGWLPVPPPQLNINVGMVSTAAPAVTCAAAYTQQAELVFSQYMNIDSVAGAVSMTQAGSTVSVTVTALDAEYDAAGENQYATRFAVVPKSGDLSGALTVSVSTGAENYAGTAMAGGYTSGILRAEEKPTELNGPETVSIGTGKEVTLALTLQPCISGKTLVVESETPSLVSVTAGEAVTDENGRAVISVRGELPGTGRITVTEPVSGISKTIEIHTQTPADDSMVQPVVAALEDGTVLTTGMTLPAGSKVTLSTATEGAVIRYTLNDTCPCKESALTYSGPITIYEDTMLRAAACLDGVYGATMKLKLSVQGNDIPGDLNADGSVDDADVAQLLWFTLFPDVYTVAGDADFNADGSVDDGDVAYLLWHTLFPEVYPL